RTRHSTPEREPVTIELGPDEVSRVAAEDDAATAAEPPSDAVKEDIGASEAVAEQPFEATDGKPADDAAATATPSEAAAEPASAFEEEPPQPDEGPAAREDDAKPSRPSYAEAGPQAISPPARASRGSVLTAGITGGIVALLAAGLLQYSRSEERRV